MKSKKLDEFHYHEILDRTSIILNLVSDTLLNHPVSKKHKKVKKKIEQITDDLFELYQVLGRSYERKSE